MDPTIGREAYRAARRIPVRHCDDYDAAVVAFRWPAIGDQFNWALDWFDPVAAGTRERRCAPSVRTAPIVRTPLPRWPRAPISSPLRWPPAAPRTAIA
jgi:hypothetical protein